MGWILFQFKFELIAVDTLIYKWHVEMLRSVDQSLDWFGKHVFRWISRRYHSSGHLHVRHLVKRVDTSYILISHNRTE